MTSEQKPEQLSLTGFEPAPRPTDRLFFALFPDPGAAARIAQLAEELRAQLGLRGRPLATGRFHVTLHHLGDHAGVPQDIVARAEEAAAMASAAPFELVFDRAASFEGRAGKRPFVLQGGEGVNAVMSFQQTLGAAMRKAGLGRFAESRFTPHVTLLYDTQLVLALAIEPVVWTATEFVLVHSLLGQSRHASLGRWRLTG